MREALLDTDILSEVLKDRDPSVRKQKEEYLLVHDRLTTSATSIMEISYGFQRRGRERELEQYLLRLAAVRVLAVDRDEAEIAGRIHGDLERSGQTIGRSDPMIAAVAIVHRLVLITGNIEHYRRIIDAGYALELDTWRLPPSGGGQATRS